MYFEYFQQNRFGIFLRKKQDPENYLKINKETLDQAINNVLDDLPFCEYVFIVGNTTLTLPIGNYCPKLTDEELYHNNSEYFDTLNDDKLHVIKVIDNKLFGDDAAFLRKFSPFAIATYMQTQFMYFIKHMHQQKKFNKIVTYVTDPNLFRNFFEYHQMQADLYYFENDTRGSRNFKKADIAQIQHLVYKKKFGLDARDNSFDDWDTEEIKKTKNVIFAGTIFHDKGSRLFIWDEFLSKYNDPDSDYYIPLKKNGIITKKAEYPHQIEKVKAFDEFNSVINHISYKQFILPEVLESRLPNYKYGLIFRCVSVHDSLTLKPVQYLMYDVLPFIDYKYDPSFLQFPEHLQKKLVIKNHQDLEDKVKYYNVHDDQRLELLHELKTFFKIYDYDERGDQLLDEEINRVFGN